MRYWIQVVGLPYNWRRDIRFEGSCKRPNGIQKMSRNLVGRQVRRVCLRGNSTMVNTVLKEGSRQRSNLPEKQIAVVS